MYYMEINKNFMHPVKDQPRLQISSFVIYGNPIETRNTAGQLFLYLCREFLLINIY